MKSKLGTSEQKMMPDFLMALEHFEYLKSVYISKTGWNAQNVGFSGSIHVINRANYLKFIDSRRLWDRSSLVIYRFHWQLSNIESNEAKPSFESLCCASRVIISELEDDQIGRIITIRFIERLISEEEKKKPRSNKKILSTFYSTLNINRFLLRFIT